MDVRKTCSDIGSGVTGGLIIGVHANKEVEIGVADSCQIVANHSTDHLCFLPARDEYRDAPAKIISVGGNTVIGFAAQPVKKADRHRYQVVNPAQKQQGS